MGLFGRLVNNIRMLFFAKLSNMVLSIAIIALISRYLTVELFGKYSFAMDFILIIIPIIKFGLSQIIIREIARDKEHADKDISMVGLVRIFIIFICVLLVILITANLELAHKVKVAIYLVMISEFLFTFVVLCTDIFVAYERMKYVPILIVINRSLALLGTISVIYFDWGFYFLFVVLIIVNLLSTIMGFYIVATKFIRPKMSFDIARIKYFLKESYPVAIAGFLVQLAFRMDTFFLKSLTDFKEVAFFGVSLRIITSLLIIPFAVSEAMLPIFSRLAQLSRPDLLYIGEKAFKLLNIILLPICVLFVIFAKEIIMIIFKEKFVPSVPSLQLFMGTFLFFSLTILLGNILISIHKQGLLSVAIMIGIGINAFSDIFLIPVYGHVGASLGKLVAFAAILAYVFYLVVHNLGMFRIYVSVLKPLFNVSLLAIAVYLLKDFNPILAIIGGSLCYGLSLFVFKTFSFAELADFRQIIEQG